MRGGPFKTQIRHIEGFSEALTFWEPESFDVTIDGLPLRRPIRFPNPGAATYGGPDPKIYPVRLDRAVAGRNLRCTGYVYAQQPHIDPTELQGVQIRIRGVGIGGFDRTWLGYPWEEGLKFGQISGEIFVEDGLESALNIDRASFRETDPHYIALRAWLWEVLRKTVFPQFKTRQDTYRAARTKKQQTAQTKALASALETAPEPLSGNVVLEKRTSPSKRAGRYQDVVRVQDSDVTLDAEAFRRIYAEVGIGKPAAETVQRVCAVLAAYGVWDQMKRDDAENLIRALSIAISK